MEEEETNEIWKQYYEQLAAIEAGAEGLDLYGFSGFSALLGSSLAAEDEVDAWIRSRMLESRRGFRCVESCQTFMGVTRDWSATATGGIAKLVNPSMVSCDEAWDYTVGLADYLVAVIHSKGAPNVPIVYEQDYLEYRRTSLSVKETRAIHADTSSTLKIEHLAALSDYVLSLDYAYTKLLAKCVTKEDFRQLLVPEWTRTYGVLVPDEGDLFRVGGNAVLKWRDVIRVVAGMRGFESLAVSGRCNVHRFFLLPPVLFILSSIVLYAQNNCAGFNAAAVIGGSIFADEVVYAANAKDSASLVRGSAMYGSYVVFNSIPAVIQSTVTDTPVIVLAAIGFISVLSMFMYGFYWYEDMRHPLQMVTRVLDELPDLYDLNGKALYFVDKRRLAVSVITEALITHYKDARYIGCARLVRRGHASTYNPVTLELNVDSYGDDRPYKLYAKTIVQAKDKGSFALKI